MKGARLEIPALPRLQKWLVSAAPHNTRSRSLLCMRPSRGTKKEKEPTR